MVTTTTSLSGQMQTYYDKVFIKRAVPWLVMLQFGQQRELPKYSGKSVRFCRYSPLPKVTTALTEGENPTGTDLSMTYVEVTVEEWGDYGKISSLVSLTAIDPEVKEKTEIFGEQAGLTIDWRIMREVAPNATAQNVAGKNLADIQPSDVLTTTELRKALRTLKRNKAMRFDGYYVGVVSPDTAYDLMGDNAWVEASKYAGSTQLFEGELGKWMGIRFVETTEPYRTDGAGNQNDSGGVYYNLILGKEAYGVTLLEGKKIYVKIPGSQDTSNPLDRYSTCGWTQIFVPKLLVSSWAVAIRTGATA